MNSELIKTEERLQETYWWFVGRRAILDHVLRRFGRQCHLSLDIGCGSGRNMQLLSRHCGRVIGLDVSPTALKFATARGFATTCGDGQSIPLRDSCVDLVSALDLLEHLDDDMRALAEFRRVLRPGGFLLVTVPAYRFLWSEHDEALMHRRRYVASEVHAKLTNSGFEVVKRSYAVFFPFLPIAFYRLFRGLVPKDPFAPKASHVILPELANNLLIALLKIEAWAMGRINLPWGTSIVVLARRTSDELPPRKARPASLSPEVETYRESLVEISLD